MDEVDRQLERDSILDEANLKAIQQRAAAIPVGQPGECEYCGLESKRLVGGACAPCRDRYGLP